MGCITRRVVTGSPAFVPLVLLIGSALAPSDLDNIFRKTCM